MKDFDIYSLGLVNASVCSSLPVDVVCERLNAEHPTGIKSRWVLADDKQFRDGKPMPCPCEQNPGTHKHYLFHC